MSFMHCSLVSLGCAFGFSNPSRQTSLSGLRALKIAQRRLRPEVRAKLLGISSARTGPNLVPEAWRFVFFDPGTRGSCRIVTVAARASSEHPAVVEAFSFARVENAAQMNVIPQGKLLVDSDKALELARSTAKLKGIRAAEYHLANPGHGPESFWDIQFFADENETAVRLRVGAKTGAVEFVNGSSKTS
jgi:hypothetical protein